MIAKRGYPHLPETTLYTSFTFRVLMYTTYSGSVTILPLSSCGQSRREPSLRRRGPRLGLRVLEELTFAIRLSDLVHQKWWVRALTQRSKRFEG